GSEPWLTIRYVSGVLGPLAWASRAATSCSVEQAASTRAMARTVAPHRNHFMSPVLLLLLAAPSGARWAYERCTVPPRPLRTPVDFPPVVRRFYGWPRSSRHGLVAWLLASRRTMLRADPILGRPPRARRRTPRNFPEGQCPTPSTPS